MWKHTNSYLFILIFCHTLAHTATHTVAHSRPHSHMAAHCDTPPSSHPHTARHAAMYTTMPTATHFRSHYCTLLHCRTLTTILLNSHGFTYIQMDSNKIKKTNKKKPIILVLGEGEIQGWSTVIISALGD